MVDVLFWICWSAAIVFPCLVRDLGPMVGLGALVLGVVAPALLAGVGAVLLIAVSVMLLLVVFYVMFSERFA